MTLRPVSTHPDASTAPASQQREAFLDAIRAVAIIRVILWHAFGAALITYFISAVPAMFFVTGSLLAKSFASRSVRTVLIDRAKRLLVPLWVFAGLAFAAMAIADAVIGSNATRVPWHRIAFWLFPVSDPQGSVWEHGYVSTPLWYLRTLLWLLLLSPLMIVAVRKARFLALALPLILVFALDVLGRDPKFIELFSPMVRVPWVVGDLALYSLFFMLGFIHREGGLRRIRTSGWLLIAVASGALATGWCLTQPVPEHIINNSHPAHLFVGLGWLALAFAAAPAITALAAARLVAPVITWITQRTLTIYLWHSVAILLAVHALNGIGLQGTLRIPGMVVVVALITLVLVLAFGWIEDIAGGRKPRIWPMTRRGAEPTTLPTSRRARRDIAKARTPLLVRIAVAAGILLIAMSALGFSGTSTSPSVALRVPSQAPAPVQVRAAFPAVSRPISADREIPLASQVTVVARDRRQATNGLPAAPAENIANALQRVTDDYVARGTTHGVQVTVMKPGQWAWTSASGTTSDGRVLRANDEFQIDSTTKTFTATLVLRAADARLLDLDAPVPTLRAVPEFTYASQFTVRQVLEHRTGLVNYRDTAAFRKNPAAIASPRDALLASQAEPLHFAPGAGQEYSSANYLVLGFLLEQVYHRSFDDLLRNELFVPLGLTHTSHEGSMPGRPNFSTAGIATTPGDLALWTAAFLRNDEVVSDAGHAALRHIDPTTNIGPGINAYCPCTKAANGQPTYTALGFTAATTMIAYVPSTDLIIVINTADAFTLSPEAGAAASDYMSALRRTVSQF